LLYPISPSHATATTEISTLSLLDALPISTKGRLKGKPEPDANLRDTENVPLNEDVDAYFQREVLPHVPDAWIDHEKTKVGYVIRSEEHTSELQSRFDLVCRLLLEKKKKRK